MPQEHQPAAERQLPELWTGSLAPKIRPVQIERTWRNDQDPIRRRATFGVLYPLWEVTIDKTEDLHTKLPTRFEQTKRRTIKGVRLYLPSSNLIFSDADFHDCKFHRPDNQGKSSVSGLTFKSDSFERCIMGGTIFRHVKFDVCLFRRCDFGDSVFQECQFLNCKFEQCTAENVSFVATEINPAAFLDGTPAPLYNYNDIVAEGEITRPQLAEEWLEIQKKTASQLLRSNIEIQQTANSNLGLLELKRAEVKARFAEIRAQRERMGSIRWTKALIQCAFAWLILHATKGGTSLSRLFLGWCILVLFYCGLLSFSHVTFLNQDCHLASFSLPLVAQQFARAASLFFAIGYTAFSGGPWATVLLTVGALIGLFWYGLVAAVVIHRVYR